MAAVASRSTERSIPWNNPISKHNVQINSKAVKAEPWMSDLLEKGWAVVKGVITPEKAADYASRANDWLEGFKLGYDRNDRSTWQKKNLPRHNHGGLYYAYSFAHAQWVWDVKTEPKIVECFEKIWGTDKLTVSFDGGNLSVPYPAEDIDNGGKRWPHADQSPLKPELAAIQGLLNILPNGPDDGGLAVMTGSVKLFTELWEAFKFEKPDGYDYHDHIRLDDAKMKWLEDRGCKVEKPCLDPGDFILWDSRTVHWGQAPTGGNPRFAVYVCYKPFDYMDEEQRELKKELFIKGWCTSHDPCTFIPKRDQDADWNINHPYGPPKLNDKALKAVGMIPY